MTVVEKEKLYKELLIERYGQVFVFSRHQLSEILSISLSSLDRRIKDKTNIPKFRKLGRKTYFSFADVVAFLAVNR